MSIGIDLHGPLTATSRTQTGSYGTIGIVKLVDKGGVDITIYAPSPEAAQLIAHSINVAWPAPVASEAA